MSIRTRSWPRVESSSKPCTSRDFFGTFRGTADRGRTVVAFAFLGGRWGQLANIGGINRSSGRTRMDGHPSHF